jgi:putative ABC transport system permease protein
MGNLRAALRLLGHQSGVSVIAALTLAIGIGANTAIFSVVDALLLRPLPYRDPAQLVTLQNRFRDQRAGVSTMELEDYRAQSGVFQAIAAVLVFDGNLTGGDRPERVQAVGAYASYFEIMGVAPLIGRTFASDEQRKGWTEIVVLSYGLWQRRFGGAPDIVGKTVRLDDDAYTVVGVMPPGFTHPDARVASAIDLWLPCGFAAEPFQEPQRQARFLDAVGRLAPGVTLAQAQAALGTVGDRLKAQYAEAYPVEPRAWSVQLRPLEEQVVGGARPGLLVLLGAVLLVLLIACTNVANLLLAQSNVRRRELAIRMALGATRARIVGQLLTESVLLAVIGGALGLLVAFWGIDLLGALAPPGLVRVRGFGIDWRVLGFTLAISVAAGLLFGVIPALQASRTDPQAAMKEGGSALGGTRRQRLLGTLVVGELALALVLLGGAGLLLRSVWNVGAVKPGFDARDVLTASLWLPQPNKLEQGKYFKFEQRDVFYRQLLARLRAAPGVATAALVSRVPLRGDPGRSQEGIIPEGREGSRADEVQLVQLRMASGDYFEAMRIPLLEGRTFADTDVEQGTQVAIVNQSLARHFWPGASAVGKRYRPPPRPLAPPRADPWTTIVGVVADVKTAGLDAPTPDELYRPTTQANGLSTSIVLRAAGGAPAALAPVLRATLHELDPDLPIYDVTPLEGVVAQAMAARNFTATVLTLFAVVALLLAALGIYGVLGYAVTQRRQEIALRMALGARAADVLGLIIGQALRLVALGLGLGGAVLVAGSRLMQSLLFGVSPTDAVTFAAIGAVLVLVALAASWLPAQRAARTSPMTALRGE